MAISEHEKITLVDLFERCSKQWSKLSHWEQNFIQDQEKRFEEWGDELRLSPKQWDILKRIDRALVSGNNDA